LSITYKAEAEIVIYCGVNYFIFTANPTLRATMFLLSPVASSFAGVAIQSAHKWPINLL